MRFTRQGRFLHLQTDGLDQPAVRWHPVTGGELDEVTPDDVPGRDLLLLTVTDDDEAGELGQQYVQPGPARLLGEFVGAVLLQPAPGLGTAQPRLASVPSLARASSGSMRVQSLYTDCASDMTSLHLSAVCRLLQPGASGAGLSAPWVQTKSG